MHTLFYWCCSEKSADSPVCSTQSLEDASQQMRSLLVHYLFLRLPLSSSVFPSRPVFLLSTLRCHSCTRLFPPPLLAPLHVSAEWHRLLSIICSFLLALPLHHSLTGLSQFQCSAHREAPGNRSSRPHHESFMNQCLFSASIGECWFQTPDSLLESNNAAPHCREYDQLAGLQVILIQFLSYYLLQYFEDFYVTRKDDDDDNINKNNNT